MSHMTCLSEFNVLSLRWTVNVLLFKSDEQGVKIRVRFIRLDMADKTGVSWVEKE